MEFTLGISAKNHKTPHRMSNNYNNNKNLWLNITIERQNPSESLWRQQTPLVRVRQHIHTLRVCEWNSIGHVHAYIESMYMFWRQLTNKKIHHTKHKTVFTIVVIYKWCVRVIPDDCNIRAIYKPTMIGWLKFCFG